MENALYSRFSRAFEEDSFLRKLRMTRNDTARLFETADWARLLAPLLPLEERLSCAQALAVFRPLLDAMAPEPPEGWLPYAYQVTSSLLFPQDDRAHTAPQRDGALCFLQFLRDNWIYVIAVLTVLFSLIVFLLLQKNFIEGMAGGAVKG